LDLDFCSPIVVLSLPYFLRPWRLQTGPQFFVWVGSFQFAPVFLGCDCLVYSKTQSLLFDKNKPALHLLQRCSRCGTSYLGN
jgi:hypothetical protein